MSGDQPQLPEGKKRAKINTIILACAPIFVALTIGICGVSSLGGVPETSQFLMATGIIAGVFACPLFAGFFITMRWKTLHPGLFFLTGLGLSFASACVLAAVAFGICSVAFI